MSTGNDIFKAILELVIIPSIPILLCILYKWVSVKSENIKDEKIKSLVNGAIKVAFTAFDVTQQTYVETLKNKGEFTKEAQKEAMAKAKEAAMNLISAEMEAAVEATYGDIDVWVESLIEQFVYANKKEDKQSLVKNLML